MCIFLLIQLQGVHELLLLKLRSNLFLFISTTLKLKILTKGLLLATLQIPYVCMANIILNLMKANIRREDCIYIVPNTETNS